MRRVVDLAARAKSFECLWSWDSECLVRAGVQVELVPALALVTGDVVGLEFPLPLRQCQNGAAAPWTIQSQ